MNKELRTDYSDIHYVKTITLGSVNPNNPLSEESRRRQTDMLNRCLNDYPKGIIIGKDVTIGRYAIGEHELTMEQTTYHVGFSRKPVWMEGNGVG